jgi:glycosyltransferase involved in cell wall biosynthesis
MLQTMRVAFISTVHGHTWPGSEFLWGEVAARLLAEGHQVFARCSADFAVSEELKELEAGGLVYQPSSSSDSRTTRILERVIDPFARLKRWRPDVIVVSAGSAFDISYSRPLSMFLKTTQIPFIIVCQFNAETFWVNAGNRNTMRQVYQRTAKAIFVSEENRRLTERQLALKISNAEIVMEPFPMRLEAPLPWPSIDGGPVNFACVARWEPGWKGQDVLFEVLSRPEWRARQWCLNLYGEGQDEAYLRALAEHYGIADRVNFIGFVKDRAQIWRQNHLQVLAARGEGGPMVLTEGMMCGRPAVITKCGHVSEYVEDGVNGFVAEFATAEIFAAAMERAWARRQEWQEMGERAHQSLSLLYDFDPVGKLLDVVLEVAR